MKLGQQMRDVITGFSGIATSKVEYLNGCVQFCLTPPMGAEGKMPEGQYIDHQRLIVVDGAVINLPAASETGGDMRDEPPAAYRG